MKSLVSFIIAFFLLFSLIIMQFLEADTTRDTADLVIVNAVVLTMDPARPRAQALAIKGDRIVYTGDAAGATALVDPARTRVIDARERLLVPGFNDAHLHFTYGSLGLLELDLRYLSSVGQVQKLVKERADRTPPGQLIQGRGWDHELFADKAWPDRSQLDLVSPNHPVVLDRSDGHSVWVNSLVIARAGIDEHTPDPPGGTIVRTADGKPSGIFKESAIDLLRISTLFPLDEAEQRRRDYQAVLGGLELARRLGVTSFQHLNDNADLFETLYKEGKLTARVSFSVPLAERAQDLEAADALRQRFPASGDWIRFGILKGFIDGSLGSGTALFLEPFADNPSSSGLAQMSYAELERRVLAADARGFQIGIHAIGDLGNRWILDAYERAAQVNGRRDARHRSEHAQVLSDADLPRFAKLGVIASMQPTHCITDKRFAEKRLGRERCRGAYAWRRLADSGARIAFGTDWPVEPLNPMEGIYAAVTRKDRAGEEGDGWFADQRLTVEEAIGLYTVGSAYAEFMEERKGMLKPGMLADMVLLERNLLLIPPQQIMDTRVDLTIVGGRVVYERSAND